MGLQVPQPEAREIPGGRLVDKFPNNFTVWQVLRQFESGKASNGRNINITARGVASTTGGAASGSGQLYYEVPVLNIMGRELASFPDFQKTLSQLGYNSGNVLIRLNYRKTDQTLYDAMSEINQFFKEADTEEDQTNATKAQTDAQVPPVASETKQQEPVQEAPDTPMAEPEIESAGNQQPDQQQDLASTTNPVVQGDAMEVDNSASRDPLQPVNVFLAPSGSTPVAALAAPNEADYAPTIAHAQLHQARLQESSRNRRLLSDRELEEKAAAQQAKINAIKSVLIKVRFPDNTSSDWEVGPNETGQFLYTAVRHVMANEEQPFHLVLPGGKTTIKDDGSSKNGLIKAYKISGRILVNLVWDDSVPAKVRKQPFLKSTVAQQGQEIKIPEPVAATDDKDNAPVAVQPPKDEKSEGSGDKLGKKIPKWLKLGKK